jgi:hypothetical protein
MTYISETVLFCNFLRPLLNGATFDFNGNATALTDEVVMVLFTAQPIDRFTIISAQNINYFVVDEALE